MSRLLDMLRRQRPGTAGDAGHYPLVVPPPAESGTPMHRAVVLDTLSGSRHPRPSHRRVLTIVFAVVGACVLALYAGVGLRRSDDDRAARQTDRRESTRAIPSNSAAPAPGPGLQSSAIEGRPVDSPDVAEPHARVRAAASGPQAPIPAPPRVRQAAARGPSTAGREQRPAEAAPSATPASVEPKPSPASEAGRTADADRDDPSLARALRYQQAGDVDKAIVEYRALLRGDGSNVQAHNNLGVLYQSKGLLDEASTEFGRAIAIDGGYARARGNLGVLLLKTGKPEAAAAEFRRILAADPNNQEATINLALAQRAGGRSQEARETLIRATEIDDRSPVAHYNLALLYEDAGEIARAVDHYEAYLRYAAAGDATTIDAVRERCRVLRRRLLPR